MAENHYYRPYYPSDSELSDSDSVASSWSRPSTPERPSNATKEELSDDRLELPDFTAFAKGLQMNLVPPSGPTLPSDKLEDKYGVNLIDKRNQYSTYDMKDASGTKINMTTKDVSTVVVLQSRDRDKTVFSQPTNCQLFLPRVYKNVTQFNVVQINLTSAFFYFRQDKENLTIQILENGRVIYPISYDASGNLITSPPQKDSSGNTISYPPLKITTTIRPGSYDINGLCTELNTQLNRTPLFYDFLNGFSDFYPLFVVNGDYSLNFNYPGDNYYDSVRNVFVNNPTKSQIVSYYFQSLTANQLSYTVNQVRVAYYYPVLKEALLDPNTILANYNLSYTDPVTGLPYSQDAIKQYLIYNFTGLNDPVATQIILQNIPQLDTYRLQHTFRYNLVNKYNVSYNTTNNRVTIQTNQLNTSLYNLLNTQYAIYFAQALSAAGITQAQYNTLLAQTTNILSVLQSMYDYLQTKMAKYFAINYGTYSRSYYAQPDYSVLIRSGLDASGISFTYNFDTGVPRETDYLQDFRNNPPYYWNKMTGLGNTEGAQRNMGNVSDPFPTSKNFPYNIAKSNVDLTRNFIDLSGVVYTDLRRKAGDIIVNIDPSKYTIFQFRSKVRQTLQVETLPRQTPYRYPAYNQNPVNGVPTNVTTLFDISYSYITPSPTLFNKINYDISYNALYGWSNVSNTTTNFGYTFTQSSNYWGPTFESISLDTRKYYFFTTPQPVLDANVYTYELSLTFSPVGGSFSDNLLAFFYHDIASFNADVSGNRLESPKNYKYKFDISGNGNFTRTFTAYQNQKYYILLRGKTTTTSLTSYRIIPWFPNGTSSNVLSQSTIFDSSADPLTLLSNYNVAINADSNFIRLPIQSTLWGSDPSQDFINNTVVSAAPVIGYDISGVSNDLTDYMPFSNSGTSNINPVAALRADPINNYLFQCNSPYNAELQTYFYTGASNALYTPGTVSGYTWKNASYRQYKIVQWYATTYLHDTNLEHTYSNTDVSPYIVPYTKATTSNTYLNGYSYTGSNSQLYIGRGVCGYTFLPGDGVWEIQRLMFKTNFLTTDSNKNFNEQIQFLGVFITAEILNDPNFSFNPANALAICMKTGSTTYNSSNLNVGFDAGFGTYYTFSNYTQLVTRSNVSLSGYSQLGQQFISDSNSFYSIIPFKGLNTTDVANLSNTNSTIKGQAVSSIIGQLSNGSTSITPIQNLTGTPIPYPYANQAYPSSVFYDGQSPPTGQDVVLSTSNPSPGVFGPPAGYDQSVNIYEQSIPNVNSHVHYLNQSNILTDLSGFALWSNEPGATTKLNAAVPGYMLFQDGQFSILPYTFYPNSYNSNTQPLARIFDNSNIQNLTVDQIYPAYETTALLAHSGNTNSFVFLGSSNDTLRFKLFTPSNGFLTELPIIPSYTIPTSNYLIQNFVFNNTQQWFVSAYDTANNQIVLFGDTGYGSGMFSNTYPGFSNSQLGMDPSGVNLYFSAYNTGFNSMKLFSLNSNDPGYVRTTSGYTITLSNTTSPLPTNYEEFAVMKNDGLEEVFFLNTTQDPSHYFKLRYYIPTTPLNSNTVIDRSQQTFSTAPVSIYPGGNGSKWMLMSDGSVRGNRNDTCDAPIRVDMAWQIFFPTMKIEMKKISNSSSPILDLTNLTYPEWPHVMMFGYSNFTSLSNDILSNSGKWGLENKNNFYVSDISFNGFYFNSYLMNFPLYPTSGGNMVSNDNSSYYLAIRGYLPTEKYQATLRFYLPQRYDFGFVKLRDISDEVVLASNSPQLFNPNYRTTLLAFNSNFTFTNKNFGSNTLQNFTGSNLSSSNFGDFLRQYRNYFLQFNSNSAIISQIQSNVQSNINNFIINDLKYILPPQALSRQRYTDPILFQILWKSALTPNFAKLDDEWGLGWNLGFPKQDTGFSTVQTGSSFYKIQQDFIYLRLNPEFNINRIDAGGKENYRQSRDTTGTTNQYYCKLLLTNFGGNATTFIHNPITFNPPLNKLTKLSFQWLFPDGSIINNGDAEWNVTVNIQERIEVPAIPDKMIFQPADPKTGKPAPLPAGFETPKQ